MERPTARRPSSSSRRLRRRSPPAISKFTSRFNFSSSEIKQNKKVKFVDFDDAPERNSRHAKRTIPNHVAGSAKTSEFKYFKKLCGTADQKGLSKSQSVQAEDSNTMRMSFSDQVEKETPCGCIHSFSPHMEQLHQEPSCSGQYDTPIYKLHEERSTYPTLKITPSAQKPLLLSPEASRNSKYENGGVFSNKRRNLIKLAAKTLSVGVDDFFQRRSDFIEELIQRLGSMQQPKTKIRITSSHMEIPKEKHIHLGHKLEWENLTHYASNLPSVPSIEEYLEPNVNSGWSIHEVRFSELYPDFGRGFHANTGHDSINYLLPSSPYYDLVPCTFGSDARDQSLVHCTCSQSPGEKFSSELMSWNVKEKEEEQSHLPLALYNPHFYHEAEELGGHMFFGSTPRKKDSALESSASYVCERENLSHIPDAEFGLDDQSLVLVKANSEHHILEFGYGLQLLDPPHYLDGSNL